MKTLILYMLSIVNKNFTKWRGAPNNSYNVIKVERQRLNLSYSTSSPLNFNKNDKQDKLDNI